MKRKDFRAWLESKHPDTLIGQRGRCMACPLATFLADQGAVHPSVDSGFYRIGSDSEIYPTPRWAGTFLRRVDRGGYYGQLVTAAEALRALAGEQTS